MPDGFQAQPPDQPRPARSDFEEAPEYDLRQPRKGMPAWVACLIVLIVLGLGMGVCGGLAVIYAVFFSTRP